MRSNIDCTSGADSLPVSTVMGPPSHGNDNEDACAAQPRILKAAPQAAPQRSLLPPAPNERVLEAELVEAAPDDEVDEVGDALGPVVEAGREEEDGRARAAEPQHVL